MFFERKVSPVSVESTKTFQMKDHIFLKHIFLNLENEIDIISPQHNLSP